MNNKRKISAPQRGNQPQLFIINYSLFIIHYLFNITLLCSVSTGGKTIRLGA